MLTINLKAGQSVRIGEEITVSCVKDGRRENRVSLKIDAPRSITVSRPVEVEDGE